MDVRERRSIIRTRPNPGGRLDYVVTLQEHIRKTSGQPIASVLIRYVPDRLLMERETFGRYLAVFADDRPDRLEELAATILEDINDQLVARWVHVSLARKAADHESIGDIRVDVEDRQPRWDNARLLARIDRF